MTNRAPSAVRLLSRYLFASGLVCLLYTFLGSSPGIGTLLNFLVTWIVPVPILDWLSGVILLLLASGTARRKRAAWIIMVIGVVISLLIFTGLIASVHLAPADVFFTEETRWALAVNLLILIALLIVLLRHRRDFTVRSPRGNAGRVLLVLIVGIAIVLQVGILGSFFYTGLGINQAKGFLLELISDPDIPSPVPDWLFALVGLGLALSLLTAFAVMLRSQRSEARLTIEEEMRVRELLAASPNDSLGYFATRRDKSAFLCEHGGVVYRVGLGVALASGDPLGDPAGWPASALAFKRHAESYGWVPAVIGASEAGARAYTEAGLRALRLGDEAVLSTASFGINNLPEVRRAVLKLTELGYTTRIRRHASIPTAELEHLSRLAGHWLDGEPERGFSMALGRFADPSDGECLMVEALFPEGDERGKIAGLLSFAPWGADGASLDVMRRHPQVDNGVTELMVAALMNDGRELGIHRVSLNFAVFRSAFTEGSRIGAGPIQRLWRRILLLASHWWQLEALYRSNAKYDPEWVPRLICYPEPSDFTRVAAAMGVAEGFVNAPRWLCPIPDQDRRTAQESAALLAVTAGSAIARPEPKRSDQLVGRAAAREAMLASGIDPYPASVSVDAACATAEGACCVAGRVLTIRDHGGVIFATLRDASGDLQILLEAGRAGAEALASFRRLVRNGDQIAVVGEIGESRTGTRSQLADSWMMTSKALRPLPDKRRGIQNPEARVRLRHVDLIVNPRQRAMVRSRSAAIQAVRSTLLGRDYLEVETPILQPVHGGANARPFRTHINAYDLDLYLRIAPELYLKRLMVGGLERVFEIGRNFRNEGADATHNPEFTMLEAYQAHADYNVMKDVMRDMVIAASRAATGSTIVRGSVGGVEHEIDLAGPWRTVTIAEAVSTALGEEVGTDTPVAELRRHAESVDMPYDPKWGWGTMVQELYEHLAEGTTVEPTFFSDFPADTSPLTRQHRHDARLAERWDLIIFGSEVGTAYSELVDPVIQRERLTAQSLAAAGGDLEAMELDEAFLAALEQGMPPSGGLGMGLDRLVMMLTGASIRETIAFPLVRPGR
ncbi:lysyl-tRNA synthetase [Actinomyces sp. Chiba101]|uniref:bifunctional lysylphosphatidylglycerol synthetase/lysine--tRNA ligase LysX n=1 Tax=Actinomyces TaxID=1654 RepID=UPI000974E707|nr:MULTISPECIES: bifunctional lysylphosphatidylglycerol synthetase/lysine--tRNA ligase LysX [Actinomyces]BAW94086.1 lysyl-tRNA synthetase [Actinomyces sp. Chiba101]GAV95355.1 lysyl-tRNA synthetase [Actinomyces denticolens]SUU13983.1 Lysylphosphatidylglycerol biosynthesis bifunctional protein LysX [Actinomyces denticolens]